MSRSIKKEPQPEWTLDDMNQLYQAISYDDGPSPSPSSQSRQNGGIINLDSDQSRQSVKMELGEPVSMKLNQLQSVNMGTTLAVAPRAIHVQPQMLRQQSQGQRLVHPRSTVQNYQNGVVPSGWVQQLPQQGRAMQLSLPSGVRMVRKGMISRPMEVSRPLASGGVSAGAGVRMAVPGSSTSITGNNMNTTPWSGRPVQIVRSQSQGLNPQGHAQYQQHGLRLVRQPQQTMIRIAPGPIQAANQSRATYLPTLTAIANGTQGQGVMLPRNTWMANQLQQQSRFNFGARQQSCMLSRAWMPDGRGGCRMVVVGHPAGYRGPAPGQPGLVSGQTPIARSGLPIPMRLPGPATVRMTYQVPSVAASSNPGTGLKLAVPSTSRAIATAPTAPKKKTPRPRARKQTYDAAPPPYLCHDVDDSESDICAEDVKPDVKQLLPLPGLPMLPWIKPEPQDWQDDHNDDDNDWMLTDEERRRKELDDFLKQVKPEPIEGALKPIKRRGRGRKGMKEADAVAAAGMPTEPPVPRKRKESTSVAEKIEKDKCPDCGRHPINRRCQKTFHGMFVRYKPHQKGPRYVGVEITEDGKLMLPCPFSDQF